jgi:hypothetical protein
MGKGILTKRAWFRRNCLVSVYVADGISWGCALGKVGSLHYHFPVG